MHRPKDWSFAFFISTAMLNLEKIKGAMTQLGISGQSLAEACDVSREAVSNWLSGESKPRPSKVVLLATALRLGVEEILNVPAEADDDKPVVAYRTRLNRPVKPEAQEAAEGIATQLLQLAPMVRGSRLFKPKQLDNPINDDEYIHEAVSAVRNELGLTHEEVIGEDHLIELLRMSGAQIAPVLWGGDKDGHENALSVYVPSTGACWVVINLGCRIDDFKYWLAHELGHVLTLHKLRGDEGELFAERFAQHLLIPNGKADQLLRLIANSSKKYRVVEEQAAYFGVSTITIVSAADRACEIANQPLTGLATPHLYGSYKKSRSVVPTVAAKLFGTNTPTTSEYISIVEQRYGTLIFEALSEWQKAKGSKDPSFISTTLNIGLADALKVSNVLWERTAHQEALH